MSSDTRGTGRLFIAPVGTPPPVTVCTEDGHVPDPPRNEDGTCALCGEGMGEWREIGLLTGGIEPYSWGPVHEDPWPRFDADAARESFVRLGQGFTEMSLSFRVGLDGLRSLRLILGTRPAYLRRTRTLYRQRSLARRRRNRR